MPEASAIGRDLSSMLPTGMSGNAPFDGLADALGQVLARARQEWRQEHEVAIAKRDTLVAEMRAELAEHRQRLDAMVGECLAGLKNGQDGEPGRDADPALIESLVENAVARAASKIPVPRDGVDADPELVAEIAAKRVSAELTEVIRADVEAISADLKAVGAGLDEKIAGQVAAAVAELPVPKNGEDGKDGDPGKAVDPAEVETLVFEKVAIAVAALPLPENGKDADPAVIAEMVAAEVAKLPPAEPGKSADPDEVRAFVAAEVEQAVKSLPVPTDGHTPTAEELAPIIDEAVSRAVAELPKPKDGDPGKSVDPMEVERMVAAEVAKLPPAKPGKSITPADVADMIVAEVGAAVAALPAPKNGEDGKSVDPMEVERLIADLIEKAVADLPPPQPGAPGESIDPAEVEGMIRGEVERVVADLPPAEPGKSVTPADVADMLADEVRAAVAALPAPQDGKSVEPAEVAAMVAEAVAKLPPAERGLEGPAGKLPIVKAWQRGVHYEGYVRAHGGSTYQALRDTAEEPPHDDWLCLASRGEAPYVGEVYGLYEEGRQYRKFDLVHQNGSEWRAKRDDPGPLPGDGWAMAAKVGDRPDPHKVQRWIALEVAKLPPPQRGPAGPQIKEWITKDYQAIPMLDDGTLGPALDVREFLELYDSEAR